MIQPAKAHNGTSRLLGGLSALLIALAMTGCAASPGVREAEKGDYKALRAALEGEALTPSETKKLAKALLSSEVKRAKEREDRAFIRSLRACSEPLIPALKARAKTRDGVGAEAALLLLEAGRWHHSTRSDEAAEDGAWRALAARDTKGSPEERRKFFTDPDERVRRAALSSALEAADPEDKKELLEVSRLDPDPLCRSRAYRALGRIGGADIEVALKDRFVAADEPGKLAIVDTWAQPAVFAKGGERQLKRLISHENGFVALHAASILARKGNGDLRARGMARLATFAEKGTAEERRLALRMLPRKSPETPALLLKLSDDEDQEIAVIALARLLGNPAHRRAAQIKLSDWARTTSPIAYQARAALAASADERVLPLLMKQAKHEDPTTRQVAGFGLVRLGAWSELAPLMGDPDPEVRRSIACRTLARSPLPRRGS